MADIAMCDGKDCPLKKKCHRYTAVPNPIRQTMANFVYDKDKKACRDFWDNKGFYQDRKFGHETNG